MILHRSTKITITAIGFYCNLSTIRHHANGADHKKHPSLPSSKACEWVLAKKCGNADDKVTKAERVDCSAIHSHSLGD